MNGVLAGHIVLRVGGPGQPYMVISGPRLLPLRDAEAVRCAAEAEITGLWALRRTPARHYLGAVQICAEAAA